jgi:1-acyl-sn-glycerol-3-phosphate acyltransferase
VIRSFLFLLWLIITVIPWALVIVIVSIFIRGDRLWWMAAGWLRQSVHAARLICGVRYEIEGMENLPAVGSLEPIILCPKHQSTWETFAFPALMTHPLAYVFKKELLLIPFFGWAMGRLDMVHIDRSKRAEAWAKVAEQGKQLMERGVWIIMFPEGTRIDRGEKGVYKSGAARLAITTGASVVPIAVTSARCWPRRSFLLRPGLVSISIAKPIPSSGRTQEDLMAETEAWIEAEMRRLDPTAYE